MNQQERKALITAAIPREHQSDFYRLIRSAGFKVQFGKTSGPFARNKPTRPIPSSLLARSVTIFTTMLEWREHEPVSVEQFLNAGKVLNQNASNEDTYLELTPAAQRFFIKLPQYATQRQDGGYIYLNALKRLGSAPNLSIMKSRFRASERQTPENVLSFTEVLSVVFAEVEENFEDASIASQMDMTLPSQSLVTLIHEKTPPAFNRLDFILMDALVMWKMIYGESTVIGFYEKFRDYSYPLTGSQMFAILDDWENVQTYPAEWIIETAMVADSAKDAMTL